MISGTPRQRLAERHLDRPLGEWVSDRRDRGESWATIAEALADATDGDVEISREAIRLWFVPEDAPL